MEKSQPLLHTPAKGPVAKLRQQSQSLFTPNTTGKVAAALQTPSPFAPQPVTPVQESKTDPKVQRALSFDPASKIESIKNLIKELNAQIQGLESEKSDSAASLSEQKSALTHLNTELRTALTEKSKLETTQVISQQQLIKLQKQHKKLQDEQKESAGASEQEIKTREDKLSQYFQQIDKLKTDLKTTAENREAINKKTTRMRQHISALENKINALKTKLSDSEQTVQKLTATILKYQTQLSSLTATQPAALIESDSKKTSEQTEPTSSGTTSSEQQLNSMLSGVSFDE